MEEQKIKQDGICIGANIRRLRLEKRMGQTELVRLVQLEGIPMSRECLVKIERGVQHIQATRHSRRPGRHLRRAAGGQRPAEKGPIKEARPGAKSGPRGHTDRPLQTRFWGQASPW